MTRLQESRKVGSAYFEESQYQKEVQILLEQSHKEEIRVAPREKNLRALIQPPESVSKLYPVPGCLGFFTELNTTIWFKR